MTDTTDTPGKARKPRRQLPPRTTAHRPEWGTPSRYTYVKKRCGCDGCAEANREYARHRSTAPQSLVDATEARNHLADLRAAGLGLRSIAKLSSVPRDTLIDLARSPITETGRQRRVHADIAKAVLSVPLDAAPTTIRVDATLSRDRLRELVVNGWTQAELCRRMGLSRITALHGLLSGRVATIPVELAERASAVHAELRDTPGGSDWAIRRAREKNWDSLSSAEGDTVAADSANHDTETPNLTNGYFDREFFQKSATWTSVKVG